MGDVLLPFRDAKREFERTYCQKVLKAADGNIAVAARIAGKGTSDFYDLLRRSGVREYGAAPKKPGRKPGQRAVA